MYKLAWNESGWLDSVEIIEDGKFLELETVMLQSWTVQMTPCTVVKKRVWCPLTFSVAQTQYKVVNCIYMPGLVTVAICSAAIPDELPP